MKEDQLLQWKHTIFCVCVCVPAVFEVTNSDAEYILKKALQAPAYTGVVRLRGLPFTCTEADVAHFFSGKTHKETHP